MRGAVIVAVALACLPAGEAFGVAPPALLRYAGLAAAPMGPGFRRARPAVQVQFCDAPSAERRGPEIQCPHTPHNRTMRRRLSVILA